MSIKEYLYNWKSKIMTLVLVTIVIVGGVLAYKYYQSMITEAKEIETNIKEDKPKVKAVKKINPKYFYVDIKGMIKTPGVYKVEEEKRVIDVINQAGGLISGADTSLINLSLKIHDSMVIVIYSKKEVQDFAKVQNEEKTAICEAKIINDACIKEKTKEEKNTKININTASLEELSSLSGIGAAKAKAIIDYREKSPFKTIEELMEVNGIGEALFAQIKENITL